MNRIQAVTLAMKPERDGRVRFSLTGKVHDLTPQRRSRLLGLTSSWASPETLRVVLCADERGGWAWSEQWTDALSEVAGGYEVRFTMRGSGHGRR